MAMGIKCGVFCVCLAQDGISLIFTEVWIELGQNETSRMGQREYNPPTCCSPEWQQQVGGIQAGVRENSGVPVALRNSMSRLPGFSFLREDCLMGLGPRDQWLSSPDLGWKVTRCPYSFRPFITLHIE